MPIIFKEDTHQYFNEKGEEYMSVSKVLSAFKPEFDAKKIAYFVGRRDGKTTDAVLKEWADTTKKACDSGTLIHASMEKFTKGDPTWVNDKDADVVVNFQKVCPLEEKSKKLSEIRLWSDQYKVAGTSDLIEEVGKNFFNVYDFKSNKKFKFHSYKEQSMLEPLSHLPSSSFIIYALQLSIYAYMHEKLTGKTCRYLALFHIDQTTREWTAIHVPYMKFEAIMLLEAWSKRSKIKALT